MKILVVGGAGYIGSFTVKALKKAGFEVVVFDSLENGHKEAILGTKIYVGDLKKDVSLLDKVFKKEKPQAVIHFAAFIEAGVSIKKPQRFFYNNVYGSLNLFKVMLKNRVLPIVFSSTAAVYGNPKKVPIEEDVFKDPTNPYGESKLMVEKILKWYGQAYGLKVVVLRYFNAAGAALDGSMGQDYPNPTHLITRACEAALGKGKSFKIFGNDYLTKDKTCVRDYIHVLDLATAHLAALKYLSKTKNLFEVYNVGSGQGYSVLEVVEMVKKVSGVNFSSDFGPRREGDPAELVAKAKKIRTQLGWRDEYSDLKTIIESSWKWHKAHPDGYGVV